MTHSAGMTKPIVIERVRGYGALAGTGRLASVALAFLLCSVAAALALECKPKTSGYYKTLDTGMPVSLSPINASGVLRSLTGTLGDPQRGRAVVIGPEKGNCIACHRVAALSSEPMHGDLGPTLNGVAARFSEAQFRQIVIDPKTFFPNTIMPSFHSTQAMERVPAALAGQPILSATEVEDVVAFLKTLR